MKEVILGKKRAIEIILLCSECVMVNTDDQPDWTEQYQESRH